MKRWVEITALLENPPEDWAVLADVFQRLGIDGTVQVDWPPSLGGYLWNPEEETADRLEDELLRVGVEAVVRREVEEEDWAESWKQFFKPRLIGAKFLVRPTWETANAGDRLEIVLDPGQAFGTGDHPTTRMCLVLLESIDLKAKRVADIGCGSGILSVAACLLGGEVVAVDVDRLSVESARHNAKLNRVRFEVFEGKGFEALGEARFDVILSNIISAALIGLAFEANSRLVSGGFWIVSGIISDNWADVLAKAESTAFVLDTKLIEGDWVAALLRKAPVS